jgi:hypothetical protein
VYFIFFQTYKINNLITYHIISCPIISNASKCGWLFRGSGISGFFLEDQEIFTVSKLNINCQLQYNLGVGDIDIWSMLSLTMDDSQGLLMEQPPAVLKKIVIAYGNFCARIKALFCEWLNIYWSIDQYVFTRKW